MRQSLNTIKKQKKHHATLLLIRTFFDRYTSVHCDFGERTSQNNKCQNIVNIFVIQLLPVLSVCLSEHERLVCNQTRPLCFNCLFRLGHILASKNGNAPCYRLKRRFYYRSKYKLGKLGNSKCKLQRMQDYLSDFVTVKGQTSSTNLLQQSCTKDSQENATHNNL